MPVNERKLAKVFDIHVGSLSDAFADGTGPDRYAPSVHALDVRLPLYGEDLERGDLRD